MPTTINGLPAPLDTDPVSDGAKAIRDLITALGRRVSGTVEIPATGGVSNATATVTFPTGAFTAPPRVMATKQTSAYLKVHTYVTGITATGCTVGIATGDGTNINATIPVAWEAIQA